MMTKACDYAQQKKKNVWCAKWRIVIGTILGRDIDLSASSSNDHNYVNSNSNFNSNSNSNSNSSNINPVETLHDPFAHPPQPQTKLTGQEFDAVKTQCLDSLNSREGRMAFAILLNRQRKCGSWFEIGESAVFGIGQVCGK
ncbi:hypothetical protein RFI_38592, partial [Reticulomyxa filosa]